MNYELINGYGLEDPGFELLRQVARKYCPEEWQETRQAVVPDEQLDLSALSVSYDEQPSFSPLSVSYDAIPSRPPQPSSSPTIPVDNGFGIGLPETQ